MIKNGSPPCCSRRDWLVSKQLGFQFRFAQVFGQRPADPCRRRSLEILMDCTQSDRATARDLPLTQPSSNRNRRTSSIFRMNFLLAGTLISFARGVQCRVIVQRSLTPASFRLWKTFRSKPNAIPGRTKSFRLPTGTVFAFRPECCSESQRNSVRLHTGIAFAFDRIPKVSAVDSDL